MANAVAQLNVRLPRALIKAAKVVALANDTSLAALVERSVSATVQAAEQNLSSVQRDTTTGTKP